MLCFKMIMGLTLISVRYLSKFRYGTFRLKIKALLDKNVEINIKLSIDITI